MHNCRYLDCIIEDYLCICYIYHGQFTAHSFNLKFCLIMEEYWSIWKQLEHVNRYWACSNLKQFALLFAEPVLSVTVAYHRKVLSAFSDKPKNGRTWIHLSPTTVQSCKWKDYVTKVEPLLMWGHRWLGRSLYQLGSSTLSVQWALCQGWLYVLVQ